MTTEQQHADPAPLDTDAIDRLSAAFDPCFGPLPAVLAVPAAGTETQRGEHLDVARWLWLCELRNGRIAEVTGYGNGGWDDELRARHAAEAPMLRP